MFGKSTITAFAVSITTALLTLASPASSAVLLQEGFESDGLGSRYTAAGAGNGSGNCCQVWGLNSTDGGNNSDSLTGAGGSDFWAASDLDDANLPSGFNASNPRNLVMNSLSTTGGASMTVSLAASTNHDNNEFLRVFFIDLDTMVKTILDEFVSTASGSALSSSTNGALGTAFADFSYVIPATVLNFQVGFEAWNSSNSEVLGIDNVTVSGTAANVPAPAVLGLMLLGLAGMGVMRRRKAA